MQSKTNQIYELMLTFDANKHLKKDGESGQTEKKFMFLLPFDI